MQLHQQVTAKPLDIQGFERLPLLVSAFFAFLSIYIYLLYFLLILENKGYK